MEQMTWEQLVKRFGGTHAEMARRLDVAPSAISHWRTRGIPRMRHREIVAKAYPRPTLAAVEPLLRADHRKS